MKHLLTYLLLCLAFGYVSNAQSNLFVGGQASFNSLLWLNQNAYGEPHELAYKFKPGIAIGLQAGAILKPKSAIVLEVNFAQQGASYDETINGTNFVREISQSYIQVPIYYQYRAKKDRNGFILDIGPSFGFISDASVSIDGEVDLDAKERFNGIDLGLLVGLGYGLDLTDNVELKLNWRNYVSLTDINAEDFQIADPDGVYEPSRNARSGIEAALTFHIGGKTRWLTDDELREKEIRRLELQKLEQEKDEEIQEEEE